MSITFKTTTQVDDASNFLASNILSKLHAGMRVLFLAGGGSGIVVLARASEILREKASEELLKNLVVMLMDERYGELDHADSNWRQLREKGFSLPGATLIPILDGSDMETTVEKFEENLEREFKNAEYKIGLFGIGKDGHTAGILPNTPATAETGLAFGYDTETFSRVTMTFPVIQKLDEAVVWAQGEEKWLVLENLKNEVLLEKMPAQILKKIPLVTIFSDFSKHE